MSKKETKIEVPEIKQAQIQKQPKPKKAKFYYSMNGKRFDKNGKVIKSGEQIQIGGNETYQSLCRKHWRSEVEDK